MGVRLGAWAGIDIDGTAALVKGFGCRPAVGIRAVLGGPASESLPGTNPRAAGSSAALRSSRAARGPARSQRGDAGSAATSPAHRDGIGVGAGARRPGGVARRRPQTASGSSLPSVCRRLPARPPRRLPIPSPINAVLCSEIISKEIDQFDHPEQARDDLPRGRLAEAEDGCSTVSGSRRLSRVRNGWMNEPARAGEEHASWSAYYRRANAR
jgi:hypothetical protein